MKYKLFQGRRGGRKLIKEVTYRCSFEVSYQCQRAKMSHKKSVRRYEILKEMAEKNSGFYELRIHAP